MSVISFTVYGQPQSAGSKSAAPFKRRDGRIGVAVRDSNPKAKDWKHAVASAARVAYTGDLLDGPLCVSMMFILPRPKGHFGKKGVRASAPQWPAVKPDVLKLARAVEDSLSGVVYRDDAQIVQESLGKRYGEPAQVAIVISSMHVGVDF